MNGCEMTLQDFIVSSIKGISDKKYDESEWLIKEHCSIYKNDTSICLSLLALLEYMKGNFNLSLHYLDDAKFLADNNNTPTDIILNEVVIGFINYAEKNNSLYTINFSKAKKLAQNKKELPFFNKIIELITAYPGGSNYTASAQKDPLVALVKIGQAVGAEKNIKKLIQTIAEETKFAMKSDRCTVFLYDKETNEIYSIVALGLGSEELRLPAGKGLVGYSIKSGETINIREAYDDPRFNRDVDLSTGYRTKTILCMPIKNINDEIIGAFQVLNKNDGYFTREDEDLLMAIASSAGISLENAKLFEKQNKMIEEQKVILDSFIDALSTSIDARDKITSGHSTRVRMYSTLIAKEFNLSEKDISILEKAAALHDIGKIGIKDSVLQKEGKLTPEEYQHIQEHVEITHHILEKVHMSDEFVKITEIACSHHEKYDGSGYYRHLKGEEIPFGGRILAVSDVFDAITSKRHYRDKMSIQKVIEIIQNGAGSHFDPSVVDKFLHIPLNKIVDVFLTENHLTLDMKDNETLSKYNFTDLYKAITCGKLKKLVAAFNKYYVGAGSNENI